MKSELLLLSLVPNVLSMAISKFTHEPEFVGKLAIKGSSYCSAVQFTNSTTKDLFISAFAQPFTSDRVYQIQDTEKIKTSPEILKNTGKLDGFITWPNEVTIGPQQVFDTESVVVAGGWFVPTKTKGGIWYATRSSTGQMGSWIPVIEKEGWFYHRVLYYDMDGDGDLDIVSCRVHKPLLADFGFGKAQGKLVYLTKISNSLKWIEKEVNEHCDVFFRMEDLDGDGNKEIIAAEFFAKKLSITYSEHPSGRFDIPDFVKVRIVEDKVGQMFDVEYKDINGDGIKDFLVSTHQEKHEEVTGAVYAYEFDSKNFKTSEFKRHTLHKDFEVISNLPKEASPGQAQAFMLPGNDKPWVVVAGDGSWKAHLLRPTSQDPLDWNYQETVLHDCGMTVGGIAVNDIDNDGILEVIIPCFDLGKGNTVIYEMKPVNKV